MSDGTGSVTYHFDQLSRMDWEQRTFTGLSESYSLNYSYNHAGQLTSLSMPIPFSSRTVGYTYDSAGRLNAVTATGFSTWSYDWQTGQTTYYPLDNFTSNMTYRAWGGLKHLNYGNGAQLDLQYNERLKVSSSTLNSIIQEAGLTTLPANYDYYPDGRVHHAYDPTVSVFDRANDYDHVGRLKEAYSGSQARGGTTNDGPYRQTYTHNAFGNLTGRTNSLWNHPLFGDSAIYTNNRRSDYGYDASGNIVGDGNEHRFDVAGSQSGSTVLNVSALTTVYLTQTYDGDGRPAKREEQRVIEQESGPPQEEWFRTYYLRSSVLGGAPVIELNGFGSKERTWIYAGGKILAQEDDALISGGIQWRHYNPATTSWLEIDGPNGRITRAEMDPLGADVSENPYVLFENPNYIDFRENERMYHDGDDPFNSGNGCSLDGIAVSCSYLNMRMEDGSVQTQYLGLYERSPYSKPADPPSAVPVTRDIKAHGLGIFEMWMPSEFRDDYRRDGYVLYVSPQNTYDPRADFRDYAKQLSNNRSIDDCMKLALMIYKAGQVFGGSNPAGNAGQIINGLMSGLTEYTAVTLGGREGPSNPNYRVGVFRTNPSDPHYASGFGDSGFRNAFQEPRSNQVRHFTFYLGAGWGIGSTLANRGLYRAEGTNNPHNPDVALGLVGTDLGSRFNGNYKQLAQDVWHRVCGQSSNLNLP